MSDPTLQTILHNVIAMRGELSAVTEQLKDSKDVAKDVDDLKKEAAENKIRTRVFYKIAACIGAVAAFSVEHLPQFISRGFSEIFHK